MKRLLNQLGTIGIVTAVTVLVWLYAEDANVQEYTGQPVRLVFIAPDAESGRLTPAAPFTVQIDFDGSNGQYQQFVAQTRESVIEVPVPLSLADDFESDEVSVRQLLEAAQQVRDLGINIKDVRPAVVTVSYEKHIDVSLGPAQVRAGVVDLAEPPIISNPQPIVIEGLPAGRKPELEGVVPIVQIRPEDVAGLTRGEADQLRLPVRLSEEIEGVTLSPATVVVLVKLADDRDTVTIGRRPVLLSYPSSINERYTVEIDEAARFITAFELEGPREQVQSIKDDPASPLVWATVRLTNEEVDAAAADGGELTKAVEIIAPPGVVLKSEVARVTIRVTPRPTAGP